jgi:hypothetical protein
VIARASGGALESVLDGTTGRLYDPDSTDDVDVLARSLREFEAGAFDARVIREQAVTFSAARFRDRFAATVAELLGGAAG